MKYSILLSGKYANDATLKQIEEYLLAGYKVILMCSAKINAEIEQLAKKCGYFHIYVSHSASIPSMCIEDGFVGKASKTDFDKLCKAFPGFNAEQYAVEHFAIDKNLIVKASAGTGKTTVMIDRIMFLLAMVDGIKPEDICMITFTNKAADNMRSKLYVKLMERYKFTQKFSYLELMESLSGMDVSTIDSFFNKLIKSEGAYLGYGQNVSIRSFTYEKKRILENVVNRLFNKTAGNYEDTFVLKIHEYVDLAMKTWEALNSRGYYLEDIERMDFGLGKTDKDDVINKNLKNILIEAEKEYRILKQQANAVTMADLKADIDALSLKGIRVHLKPYRYIFVDEFQDTDNSQIRSIAWLKKIMQCQIFVVGDIKQSIYRFRGAEESAFDRLNDAMNNTCAVMVLKKNYRTAGNIMMALNNVFQGWAKGSLLKLTKEEDAVPTLADSLQPELISYQKADQQQGLFLNKIREVLQWEAQNIAKAEPHRDTSICVLVRSNWEAHLIAKWLREAQIPAVTSTEGGFYQTEPVLDVMHLLGAILYANTPIMLFNYIYTPYSRVNLKYSVLNSFCGDEAKLAAYLKNLLYKDGWELILENSKKMPFFHLLRDTIETRKPSLVYAAKRKLELEAKNLSGKQLEQQVKYDVARYNLNLNKLMEKFSVIFSGDYASLLAAYSYLQLMSATNKAEDTIYPEVEKDDSSSVVQVMTVHKAKGLEFSTVILPKTDSQFHRNWDKTSNGQFELITNYNEQLRNLEAGWKYKSRNKIYQNSVYEHDYTNEILATTREELRILYVALTRTEHRLICMRKTNTEDNSWGNYLHHLCIKQK